MHIKNSSFFCLTVSIQICVQPSTVAVNVTLYSHLPLTDVLLYAVLLRRRCCWGRAVQQSIDIACPR